MSVDLGDDIRVKRVVSTFCLRRRDDEQANDQREKQGKGTLQEKTLPYGFDTSSIEQNRTDFNDRQEKIEQHLKRMLHFQKTCDILRLKNDMGG